MFEVVQVVLFFSDKGLLANAHGICTYFSKLRLWTSAEKHQAPVTSRIFRRASANARWLSFPLFFRTMWKNGPSWVDRLKGDWG